MRTQPMSHIVLDHLDSESDNVTLTAAALDEHGLGLEWFKADQTSHM